MKRCFLCLLCVLLLFIPTLVSAEEASIDDNYSFDFDFTFTLNAHAFPKLMRSRMTGYAALINKLGFRGNVAWTRSTESFELDSELYFTDNPSLSFPLQVWGAQPRIFISSPLIQDEVLLLNMVALLEFSVKAKNTLGIPLPYLAYLYPLTNEYALSGPVNIWHSVIGTYTKSGKITTKQLRTLTESWSEEFATNPDLQRWITALAEGSDNARDAVETELTHIPEYIEKITNGCKPVSIKIQDGSQTWTTSGKEVLFSQQETDEGLTLSVTLPASENRYVPSLTYSGIKDASTLSFRLEASLMRDPYIVATDDPIPANTMQTSTAQSDSSYDKFSDENELYYDEDESDHGFYDDYGESGTMQETSFPAGLLDLVVEAQSIPVSLPAESDFNIMINVQEKLFPHFSTKIHGETKKDGSLILSVRKLRQEESESEEILRCTGTLVPADLRDIPNYMFRNLDDVYNVFSFNEQSLAAFRHNVLPKMIDSIFKFVEAAPTSACQSLLDDLTDSGILDMVMKY